MSILLIGLDDPLVEVLGRRLVAAGDEVRVLVTDGGGDRYRNAGLHVATGDRLDDDDLIERAAQNVRTIVLGDLRSLEVMDAVVTGAKAADVSRLVAVVPTPLDDLVTKLAESGLEYVVLVTGRRPLTRRRKLGDEPLAAAVDAADDLADELHVVLDLTSSASWAVLKLSPPV
jgi:hypothetical protein